MAPAQRREVERSREWPSFRTQARRNIRPYAPRFVSPGHDFPKLSDLTSREDDLAFITEAKHESQTKRFVRCRRARPRGRASTRARVRRRWFPTTCLSGAALVRSLGLHVSGPRKRQTGRKAGTQSQGPAYFFAGSLAAERMLPRVAQASRAPDRFGNSRGEACWWFRVPQGARQANTGPLGSVRHLKGPLSVSVRSALRQRPYAARTEA